MTSDEFRTSVRTAVLYPSYRLSGTFRAVLEHLVDMPNRSTIPTFTDVAIRTNGTMLARLIAHGEWRPVSIFIEEQEQEGEYTLTMLTSDILDFCYITRLDPAARFLLMQLVQASMVDDKALQNL
jgi:hypothetical protein